MQNIGIIGCGWLGLHIANYFDLEIYTTTSTLEKIESLSHLGYNPTLLSLSDHAGEEIKTWEVLDRLDAIVI